MSIWGDNPEWFDEFDEWLEHEAAKGRFGPELQAQAQLGNFCGCEWWEKLNGDGRLGIEAETAFFERQMDAAEWLTDAELDAKVRADREASTGERG